MSHPIENIMQSSMEEIKRLADVNTVIGSPIITEDHTMILPVSKVALGLLVGGGEYAAATPIKKSSLDTRSESEYPFIGASTVGMSLTPLAFLAVQNGTVRVLPAKEDCPADRLIDLAPQVIDAAERMIKEYAASPKKEEAKNCEKVFAAEKKVKKVYAARKLRRDHKPFAYKIEYETTGDELE